MNILLVIYLAGMIVCYFVGKYTWIERIGEYTISDRRFILMTCLFSWVGVFSHFVTHLIEGNFKGGDKKAKW